jgi:hypothetical protein
MLKVKWWLITGCHNEEVILLVGLNPCSAWDCVRKMSKVSGVSVMMTYQLLEWDWFISNSNILIGCVNGVLQENI